MYIYMISIHCQFLLVFMKVKKVITVMLTE